jgi:hypothetical protein
MTSPSEEEKQWAAFVDWAQTIKLAILKCRTSGHRFPDWDDTKRTRIARHPDRSYTITAPCTRRCGVVLTRYIGQDGYILRSNKMSHDYSQAHSPDYDPNKAYMLPAAARTGRGFSRAQRAYLRAELLERLSEWITDEPE